MISGNYGKLENGMKFFGSKIKTIMDQNKDINMKFFHALANYKYRKKFIKSIKVNGDVVAERSCIKVDVVKFFSLLFDERYCNRPTLKRNCLCS